MTSTARWAKSSYSSNHEACVEVARVPGAAGMRDTKALGTGPELWVSSDTWRAFVHVTVANGFTR
ncbi:DUF397 domain-containing protein [Streptomyces sp. RFCAC02]|uniref:DUF397 domain-containing protein n=1 Tax=Streptomyces sp. RFCAC02 TaxID=2499143 RepID=UPI001020E00F|nr:DUF397 domain-containing protein [Streptomyces sp. RFCAC02]